MWHGIKYRATYTDYIGTWTALWGNSINGSLKQWMDNIMQAIDGGYVYNILTEDRNSWRCCTIGRKLLLILKQDGRPMNELDTWARVKTNRHVARLRRLGGRLKILGGNS